MLWLTVLSVGKFLLYFFLGVFIVGGITAGWMFWFCIEKGYIPFSDEEEDEFFSDFDPFKKI